MADSIGSVGITLSADIAQFVSDLGKASLIAQREMATTARAQEQADKAAQKFIQSLKDEAATFGKTRDEVLKYRAEQMGMTQQAQQYIDAIAKARKEQEALGNGLEHVGFQSAGAKRELLVLAHELSQGNYSRFAGSLMVIGERTNIMSVAFSGAGLAILGTTAIFAGFIAAIIKGAMEQKAFNDALILTNNYAGQTNESFAALAQQTAKLSDSTVGAARSMAEAFVSTGRVGPANLRLMTQAALEFERVSDQKAEEVVKDFARMADGVTRWAQEANKQYHFLTVGQYEYIRTLEEQGKAEEAERVVLQALHSQLQMETANLGNFARAWHWVKEEASAAIDAIKGWGRDQTGVQMAQTEVAFAQAQVARARNNGGSGQAEMLRLQQAEDALRAAQQSEFRKQESAAAHAQAAADQERGIKASDFIKNLREQTNEQAKLNKELTEYRAAVKAMADAGKPVSASQQAQDEAAIRAKFGRKGIAEAAKEEHATLQQRLQQLQEELKAEQDALAYNQSYVKGLYGAGEVSATDYYAELRRIAEAGAQAQQDTYARQIAAQEAFIRSYSGKDKGAKTIETQTAITKLRAEAAKAQQDAAQKVVLANQQETESMKQLGEQVASFNASLLESQGQYEAASALRTAVAIDKARKLAMQAMPGPSTGNFARMDRGQVADRVDLEGFVREQELLRAMEDAKKRITILDEQRNTQESLYLLQATRGGVSLIEQETTLRGLRQTTLQDQEQLVQKVEQLAKAANPGDPIILFAEQLRLNLEKARDAVDPALERLRTASKSAADSMAEDVGRSIENWKNFRELLTSLAKDVEHMFVQVLVVDPLKKEFEGFMRGMTEGDNPIGNMFKDALGFSSSTGAATASSSALMQLTTSAEAAAAALSSISASSSAQSGGSFLSFLGSSFGGGGGAEGASFIGDDIGASMFAGFAADGGMFTPGQWGIVGENGPERIYAGRDGVTVFPNTQGNMDAKDSGGDRWTIVNNTSVPFGSATHMRISPTDRALIIEEAVQHVTAHAYDGNTKFSQALQRNFGLTRKR